MDKNYFSKTRILDGGMGQELLKRGLKPRGTLWSAEALIDEKLTDNANMRGDQLIFGLNEIKNDFPDKIKEVRGKGLLTAFEMYDSKYLDGHTVSIELLNNGIYAKETHHSTVRIAPALTIKPEYIDQIAAGVRKVVKNL